ncbi:unnamed protein product [Arabidopsis halleri]
MSYDFAPPPLCRGSKDKKKPPPSGDSQRREKHLKPHRETGTAALKRSNHSQRRSFGRRVQETPLTTTTEACPSGRLKPEWMKETK